MKEQIFISVRWFVFPMVFFMLFATLAFAQVYQYRDKNGQLHFTNALSEIPEDQQPPVLIKGPDKPAKPKEADPPKEAPQAENADKPREIPLVEDLNEEKAALDKCYARLMKRKKTLKTEKQTLKTPEQVREYRRKVTRLNDEISVYKKRNSAFQKKADTYNAAVREKGEE